LTHFYGFKTTIVACPTMREASGLAMSSRNMRLNEQELHDALVIIETLRFIEAAKNKLTVHETLASAKNNFNSSNLSLEYLSIVDPETLSELSEWQENQICCIAAHCGSVRLIDNLLF
jgi:pantoate--beta-alanine ligase